MHSDIPGWIITIDEFSPGIFKVTLTDKDGRKAEVVDNATETTIDLAKEYAFQIQRQLSRSWNRFLYEFCLLNVADRPLSATEFNELAFGSWYVEHNNKRLLYNGKDSWLVFQTNEADEWRDKSIIKYDQIKYLNFIRLIDQLKG